MVRRNQRQKPLYTPSSIVVSANRRSFIKEHFGADSNTSRTPERRWATYSRPRIGVRSHTGRVRPSPQHIEEPARHYSHAKTQPGESIGLPRSSTGSERVAGFGYRSPWWRVRGVQRPGVFEESLVPPAPDPRGTGNPHLSLGSRRALAELAHMYRYRWIDRSGSLALDRCPFWESSFNPGGEPSGSQLAHIRQYALPVGEPRKLGPPHIGT
jgi:hypothetical protein